MEVSSSGPALDCLEGRRCDLASEHVRHYEADGGASRAADRDRGPDVISRGAFEVLGGEQSEELAGAGVELAGHEIHRLIRDQH